MRLVIARCAVDYAGRLTAHLPMATRLILVKADGSVSVHADDRAYKPLNWMSPPCTIAVATEVSVPAVSAGPVPEVWEVTGRDGDRLQIVLAEILHDSSHDLGIDPGLQKDGVEAHLQALLAANPEVLGAGLSLVRREHPTPIGPVDLLLRRSGGPGPSGPGSSGPGSGGYVAVEVKRRGDIDGVEQLTRYLELLRRDPLLGDVGGVFAAQQIRPQARTLAQDRGITCVTVDYDVLRGLDDPADRLF